MTSTTLLVCGSRDFVDDVTAFFWLDFLWALREEEERPIVRVVHGAARGADRIAGAWARTKGIVPLAFPADWTKYGNRAGPIRNGKMLRATSPDLVCAFPGGSGTLDMKSQARGAGVPVAEVQSVLLLTDRRVCSICEVDRDPCACGSEALSYEWPWCSSGALLRPFFQGGLAIAAKERISCAMARAAAEGWEASVDQRMVFGPDPAARRWTMREAAAIMATRCHSSEPSPRSSSRTAT